MPSGKMRPNRLERPILACRRGDRSRDGAGYTEGSASRDVRLRCDVLAARHPREKPSSRMHGRAGWPVKPAREAIDRRPRVAPLAEASHPGPSRRMPASPALPVELDELAPFEPVHRPETTAATRRNGPLPLPQAWKRSRTAGRFLKHRADSTGRTPVRRAPAPEGASAPGTTISPDADRASSPRRGAGARATSSPPRRDERSARARDGP